MGLLNILVELAHAAGVGGQGSDLVVEAIADILLALRVEVKVGD